MESLFDPAENKEIINRINHLTYETPAQWGKMNVAQMTAHCQMPLKVAYGEVELKRGLLGILFGKMAKRSFLGDKPFSRNGPTHPKFIVKDQREFEDEKKKLISYVERFSSVGQDAITSKTHPFFGPMTTDEWDRLQWKHLDHHLRQFGV